MKTPRSEFTQTLRSAGTGDVAAAERLWSLLYDELRRIAHRQLLGERPDHTLSTTALVHEAYLRLVDQVEAGRDERTYFFGVAARVMRQVLVDYARARAAKKRGGGLRNVPLDEARYLTDERAEELMALDEALSKLERLNARLSRVVECCYFGGFTQKETADVLNVSVRTVERDWLKAKAWLYHEIHGPSGNA